MTSVATLLSQNERIPFSQLHRLEATLTPVALSEAQKAEFQKIHEMAIMPEYSHIEGPADQVYAEVKVGGNTVAKIYNSGSIESSNAMGGRIQSILQRQDTQLSGPNGAQERAEILARALGGRIEKTTDAMTQGEWEASPKQHLVTDWDALRRDPRVAGYYRTNPDTLLQTQLLATEEKVA